MLLKRRKLFWLIGILCLCSACSFLEQKQGVTGSASNQDVLSLTYDGEPYVVLNDNEPDFSETEKKQQDSYISLSELDDLQRCGSAQALLGKDTMPQEDEERESIGMVKPSGWQTVRYDALIATKYLYNRSHLIGWQLSGLNDDARNLITGTRYMNTEGMLPFENIVANYIKATNEQVLYRVTPVFQGKELVARGVIMEACSIADDCESVGYHVYVFNVQPDIKIDYANGDSEIATNEQVPQIDETQSQQTYVLNTSSQLFHTEDCYNAAKISEKNKKIVQSTAAQLLEEGYTQAKCCAE